MKSSLKQISMLILAVLMSSCGDSGTSTKTQIPDPVTQPEANASVFQRTCDGIKGLIAKKEYKQAQEALVVFNQFKLTPEQQKIVDQIQAQIPKVN